MVKNRYKYRLLLEPPKSAATTRKTSIHVEFLSPLREKENVILTWHTKQLQDTPDWAQNQETWTVEKIFHQTNEAVEKADIAILSPASHSLGDMV